MANASFVQTNFQGGEWSELAQGRLEHPRYRTSMKVCLNGFPVEEGAWVRRPGTRHTLPTRGGAAGKLLKFTFNQLQPYNIELTPGHMRFLTGQSVAQGGIVVVGSISSTTPAVLTVPAPPWTTNDQIVLQSRDVGTASVLAKIANRALSLVALTSTTFALYDPITTAPIDGSQIVWTSALNAVAGKVQDIATPWLTTATVQSCRIVQAERTGLVLQAATKPQMILATTVPGVSTDAQFTMSPASFLDGPYLDAYPGSTLSPSGTVGLINVTLGFLGYVATKAYKVGDYVNVGGVGYRSLLDANVNNAPASSPTYWTVVPFSAPVGPSGFLASDIGRAVRLYSASPAVAWAVGTTYATGDMVTNASVGYVSLQSGNVGNTPATSPSYWAVASPGWTWGRISAMSNAGQVDPTGGSNIGSMTSMAGLAAAFDGSTVALSSASAASAQYVVGNGSAAYYYFNDYVGKNFTTNTTINSAVITPSTDHGFGYHFGVGGGPASLVSLVLNLRGSTTIPANSSDGVLLGTTTVTNVTTAVAIASNDTVTPFKCIWVEVAMVGYVQPGYNGGFQSFVAQLQIYNSANPPGNTVQVQVLGNPLPNTSTITSWRLGAFSDTTGWPTNGTYHEGRFWLSGAIANRFDASNSNDLFNFAPTNAAGAVGDGNAISATFNSAKTNSIFWMKPDLQGIVCGTQEGEYLLQATSANQVMTPSNIQGHLVTHYGCANIEPVQTGITTMFVQAHTRRVHEYLSDIFSGRFFAPNASEMAKHITKPGIAELAYQEELTPIVWARRTDGKFIGSTYRRVSLSSSAEPVFNGWHRHELGSNRMVESLVGGPSTDGTLDSITMITNDPETDIRHVEVMTNFFEEDNTIMDAWFLDNAIVPTAAHAITNPITGLQFLGLSHLEGKKVTAWIAGLDCGDYQVTNGIINVPYGGDPDGLFTYAELTKLSASQPTSNLVSVDGLLNIPAVIGFTYKSQGQLNRPHEPQATGAQQGPAFGKSRRLHQFAVQLVNSQAVKFGTDLLGKLRPAKLETPGGRAYAKNQLFSGVYQDTIEDTESYDSRIAWQIDRPYPATITAIGGFLNTVDR